MAKGLKDTRTADEKYVAPRELFREKPSQERLIVQTGEERVPLKKHVTITQHTEKKKFYSANVTYRMTEGDLAPQKERTILFKRGEEELL